MSFVPVSGKIQVFLEGFACVYASVSFLDDRSGITINIRTQPRFITKQQSESYDWATKYWRGQIEELQTELKRLHP